MPIFFRAFAALLFLSLMITAPAFAKTSNMTKDFVKNAFIGNQFEINSSRLALEMSDNDDVQDFARTMIDDHTDAMNQLRSILADNDEVTLPENFGLDSKHRKIMTKLQKAKAGSEFDKKYIEAQKDAHEDTIDLFRKYARKGDDPALRQFAQDTLPTLEKHYRDVKQVKKDLSLSY